MSDEESLPSYATDPTWSDLEPLPQDDGGPNALATIAYTDEYREASSYLRAVMAANELSERALALTAHVIDLNPAHYTVWLYRAKMLEVLQGNVEDELEWLNGVSLRHIKNYQIWHHRETLVARLSEHIAEGFVEGGAAKLDEVMRLELEFLAEMFEKDQKNYHVWSYRQWLVRKFDLWEGYGEMEEIERFLRLDVRNNSAWNHRWFLVFGREKDDGSKLSQWTAGEGVWQRELDYAKESIRLAPQNESAWSYLKGLLKKNGLRMSYATDFAREFAEVEPGTAVSTQTDLSKLAVRSTFALDVLAEAYSEQEATKKEAELALRLLAERYDPIRKNFWEYKRTVLGLSPTRQDGGDVAVTIT